MAVMCGRRPGRHIAVAGFALLLAVNVVNGQFRGLQKPAANTKTAASQPTPQPTPQASPTATPNPLVIPVPQIAIESIQLEQRLSSISDRLVSNESINETAQQVNELKASADEKIAETDSILNAGAIFSELEQLSVDWQGLKKDVEDLSANLAKQATSLDNEIRSLRSEESRWSATATALKSQTSPPELLDLTGKTIGNLGTAVNLAEERRSRVVGLQQTVAQQGSIVTAEIEQLKRAMAVSQRSLLEVDSPPLWKVQFGSQSQDSFARLLERSYAGDMKRLKAFVKTKRTVLTLALLTTLGALIFFSWLTLKARSKTAGSEEPKPDPIFRRPASLALLVGIVMTMPLFHDAPRGARSLLYVIGIIPALRLLKPRLSTARRQILIASFVSLAVWQFIIFLRVPLWIKRDLVEIFVILVVGLLAWLSRKAQQERSTRSLAMSGVYVASALLGVAFVANLVGYVGFCDLLIQATLASAYRAVALYTIFVIGSLLISAGLQADASQRFSSIRTSGRRLARRLSIALAVITLLAWIHQTLNLFAIRQDVYDAISRALNYQFKIGSATLAVSSIVAFILTLLFGYLVAMVLRSILGEEILPRLNLARGTPNAVATITHYVLLVLIFLLALAAAGVELSKFTLLTGALGVGLGFGLQNVVNNFVSGLILLFERPVRLGDLLEIGGVSGEVTKIGFRSSTLHAFDGSDLIIPNATLISQQVINWTLTGTRRRVVLTVPVAYGNDPTQVRDLLRKTVTAHADVLRVPVPMVLFLGFSDNAQNFEIRFWAARPELVAELKSDVALNIAAALTEAGINVPIPQVHIRTPDQKPRETVAANKDGA
jgi:potassium efflux system protein